ncbi:DUF465 domain-containing protein [Rhizobium rosettiformans]|uniref:DUF465 domain-containing protein n=2 Tax=Rhizobium/Agrobacterium group TaxID=227290 RepID=A0ABX7ERF0_9HYPH|nr:DUF465 domain-containing protein [Rhizobium rosettiformans]
MKTSIDGTYRNHTINELEQSTGNAHIGMARKEIAMKQLLKALRARHSIVAAKIDEEQRRPRPDGIRVRALKKIRLHLKEQITLLERGDAMKATAARPKASNFGSPLLAGR